MTQICVAPCSGLQGQSSITAAQPPTPLPSELHQGRPASCSNRRSRGPSSGLGLPPPGHPNPGGGRAAARRHRGCPAKWRRNRQPRKEAGERVARGVATNHTPARHCADSTSYAWLDTAPLVLIFERPHLQNHLSLPQFYLARESAYNLFTSRFFIGQQTNEITFLMPIRPIFSGQMQRHMHTDTRKSGEKKGSYIPFLIIEPIRYIRKT